MKKLLSLCLVLLLLVSLPCFAAAEPFAQDVRLEDYFTARDLSGDWDEDEAQEIALDGSLTITEEGVYVLSGTIADGCITVNVESDAKVQLVLNGVSVTASNGPCLVVENANKVFITLAAGSENSFVSAAFDQNAAADGAVYAKDDIVFNGKGRLSISSAGHGVVGKDDVKFGGGVYVINAEGRGISGKDSVRIYDGSYTIDCGKDPIRSKNADMDGKGYVLILGGQFILNGNTAD